VGRSACGRRGFTLIEILLVLAVLAIVIGVAYPLLSGSFERNQMSQAANEVREKLAATGIYAKDSGLTYQFRFEPGGRRYLVVPDELDSDAATSGTSLSARYPMHSEQLPEGYHFQSDSENPNGQTFGQTVFLPIREDVMKTFANANELSSASGWPALLFYPDGTAKPVPVIVRNDAKQSITLSVRELTGAVTMGQVTQEQR
jgi:prepilin-type N-terminal cleavage/methylation domain-containing protein